MLSWPTPQAFAYDPAGNRHTSNTTDIYSYTGNNELNAYDDTTCEYDSNGNLIKKIVGSIVTSYVYNIEDRLTQVWSGEPETGTLTARYYYDPFGRRLWKEVSGIMKRASVFYIAVFLVLSIATVSANNDHDTELDELHSLIIYFDKLKTSNKLPGLEVESKGKLAVYKIKENMHIEPYVYNEMVDEIKSCNNLYLIDATNDDKNLKYFFCKSINRSFVLIVSYKNINGEWQYIE